jgi:tetratricopeptide (TPR) repeat protein
MSARESSPESARRPPPSPLEGGPWRPLAPEELIRRGPVTDPAGSKSQPPRPNLERRQQLEHIIKDRPADMEPYLELAAIYRELGRSVEATRVLKAAAEVEPNDRRVLWELEEASLARALQQLRDVREVAERLRTSEADRELERAQVDWACRRAEVCRQRLKRDPEAHHLRVVLGEALRDLGNYEEAIEAVAPALDVDQQAPLAYLLRGQCLEMLGKPQQALRAYRHAAMRRSVPAPAKLRVTAMRAACDLAERLGLPASHELYLQALRRAEQDLASRSADSGPQDAAASAPEPPIEEATQ